MTVIWYPEWKTAPHRKGRSCGEIEKTTRSARPMEGPSAAVLSAGARRQNEASG
jgi:hypothetical protein